MKKVFIKEACTANDLDESVLDWLERADAAFILLQIGAREGLGAPISKKEVCNAGLKCNERTKLQRVDELIAAGLVTYERQVYRNSGSLALTDLGRQVCAKLKEIYDLMTGAKGAKVLRLTDEDGKEYFVRADNLYADDGNESQQKLEEEWRERALIRKRDEMAAYTIYKESCENLGRIPVSRRMWTSAKAHNKDPQAYEPKV